MANNKKKTVKDFKKTPPKSKKELTLDAMYKYIAENGSNEDKAWFVDTYYSSKITFKRNGKDGEEKESKRLNIYTLRNKFAERFFPELNVKKKVVASLSWDAKIDALLK